MINKSFFAACLLLLAASLLQAQVGIGTSNVNGSAKLQIDATDKGFLPPRVTLTGTADITTIATPATGLLVYNISSAGTSPNNVTPGYYFYDGSKWQRVINSDSFTSLPTIVIGTQHWMEKNLEVTSYRNGDTIPQVSDPSTWAGLTTGAWCWYNNDPANGAVYGKLYNWYAVADSRGLCPSGWHVPSDVEWTTLSDKLGGSTIAGGKMKSPGTSRWISPNGGANNSSGFAGLPAGSRTYLMGSFAGIGSLGLWWSAKEDGDYYAFYRELSNSDAQLRTGGGYKVSGYSVRCVRD